MKANHIAILVRDLDAVARALPGTCTLHPTEEHPAEGTREQYVTLGDETVPALLLMQAIAEGPYARALRKRGPGLHHIGCWCADIEEEIARGDASRLLLHPISLGTRESGTVWLCRPGVPFLVELTQEDEPSPRKLKNASLLLPAETRIPAFAAALTTNLTIRTGDENAIMMKADGLQVRIDPDVG